MRVFKLPDLGEGIHEGEIIEVQVSTNDEVTEGQPILTIETDKAAVEIPSPFTGTVTTIHVTPHDIVHVGDNLMEFSSDEEENTVIEKEGKSDEHAQSAPQPPERVVETEAEPATKKKGGIVPASPSTRRIARELGVDLANVKGTGPGGRVSAEDVRAHAEHPQKKEQQAKTTEREERVPLRSVRRVIARQMALSWKEIPHVTHMDEADITHLEAERKKYKDQVAERGGKLTLTTFALKAVVMALKTYPFFNSSLDLEHEEIVLKHYFNIGVATDTDQGLIVPVIKDVDKKTIVELAVELPELASQAREKKLTLEQLKGGTFTVTNIGSLGGTSFTPIINFPESSILGLGQARWKPVVLGKDEKDLSVIPRLILPLVLAFDHRIVDGAQGARFLNLVKEVLEDPVALLLQGDG